MNKASRKVNRKLPDAMRAKCIKKGEVRNPDGKNGADGHHKCLPFSDEALKVNVEIMRDPLAPFAIRLNAAQWIFERAHGRMPQALMNPDGSNIPPAIVLQVAGILSDKPGGTDGD